MASVAIAPAEAAERPWMAAAWLIEAAGMRYACGKVLKKERG